MYLCAKHAALVTEEVCTPASGNWDINSGSQEFSFPEGAWTAWEAARAVSSAWGPGLQKLAHRRNSGLPALQWEKVGRWERVTGKSGNGCYLWRGLKGMVGTKAIMGTGWS